MGPWKELGRYGFVGVELVTLVAAGFFAGRWLDARIHGGGYVAWAGLLVGIFGAFQLLATTARRLRQETERADAEEQVEEARRLVDAALRARLEAAEAREAAPAKREPPGTPPAGGAAGGDA